jgi:hypothetical protein
MQYGQCPTLLENGERCIRSAMHHGLCNATQAGRRSCSQCGRTFRKRGVGLDWHLEQAHGATQRVAA